MFVHTSRARGTPEVSVQQESAIAPDAADAVRAFYLEAGDDDARDPIVIAVDAPEEFAEQCWDAGLSVHVRDVAEGRTVLSIVDHDGRRIVLTPRLLDGSG